ncbi:putative zinc finger protein [Eutypa lata UCREL1]|uniref:Putative zinc finger protein n=1 Tax=Eutypa lata (strain UCR-EL1) TaxID=1287681 RepID=M7T195_EUTLA|nr:putative zinc finger protein [Eutypa lata UCREL1]
MNSTDLFDEFIPQVRELCDSVYSQPGFSPRITYHMLGLSLIESFAQSLDSEPQRRNVPDPLDEFLESLDQTFEESNEMDQDFLEEIGGPHQNVPGGSTTANTDPSMNIFGTHHGSSGSQIAPMGTVPSYQSRSVPPNTPYSANAMPTSSSEPPPHSNLRATLPDQGEATSATTTVDNSGTTSIAMGSSSAGGSPAPILAAAAASSSSSNPATTGAGSSSSSKVEANDCCEVCGYRPKGDPQWFKGSMAKHKKLQHSTGPPIMYRCPFPGCTSAYKNRPDNLRQHQIEKGHFIDAAGGGGDGEGSEGTGTGSVNTPPTTTTTTVATTSKRPSKKRKKTSAS